MNWKSMKAIVASAVFLPLIVVSSVMFWLRAKDQIKPPNKDMWE